MVDTKEVSVNENYDKEHIERVIWSHTQKEGPVVVVFAAIHGNELAGLHAGRRLAERLSTQREALKGSIYIVSGNRKAIREGVRFIDRDLNRLWNEVSRNASPKTEPVSQEWEEAEEILATINQVLETHSQADDISFIDLHTTSVESCAFILFNDTLENRTSAAHFPAPQILGIEETIHGTLMSYINDLGYSAIGFEAGRHEDTDSIERTEAFLYLYLHYRGFYTLKDSEIETHRRVMRSASKIPERYYEITYRHYVEDATEFSMKKGYLNFDKIRKGEKLASYKGEPVYAPKNGLIFMPLYQAKGNDGFFILQARSAVWLQISAVLRDSFLNRYLHVLPGVSMEGDSVYVVNLKVARFFVKEIFHLFGFRVIKKDQHTLICYKREA